jgi:hypothetical protein
MDEEMKRIIKTRGTSKTLSITQLRLAVHYTSCKG